MSLPTMKNIKKKISLLDDILEALIVEDQNDVDLYMNALKF